MTDAAILEDGRDRILERIRTTLATVQGFPHYADPVTGRWFEAPEGSWTGGFWAGLLWRAYAMTGDEALGEAAERWTLRLAPRVHDKTHDIGFLFYYSSALGWHVGQDGRIRQQGLRAAEQLASTFHPKAGVIPVGIHAEVASGLDDVTIDCMVNLPLLWWAWKETGEDRFFQVALSHARQTAAWHVKPDASTYQSVHFDPDSGRPLRKHNHQGFNEETCWSRGQAWCVYGYALAHAYTGREEFLALVERAAEYFWRRLPDDRVPFYDFDDAGIPAVPRDTSASAIAASAFLALAAARPDRPYAEWAHTILTSIIQGYLTPVGPDDRRPQGILLHGCYNRHTGEGPDHELIWGDYFLLEALVSAERGWRLVGPGGG